MKIAIYYPWLHLKSGAERTILETVKRSKHKYTIFTNHYDRNGTYPEFKNLKVVQLKKVPVRRNIFSVAKAAFIIASQKIYLKGFSLFLVHSEGIGDLILIRNNKIPTICFCHTPLRPVFDEQYKNIARSKRSFFSKIIYKILDIFFRIADRYLWKKYKYIFFNSKESLRRAKNGGLINKKTEFGVLHPGVDWENVKPTWWYEKYFLVPGRIMWTKNIELAIKSFLLFEKHKNDRGFKLVIAGQVDNKSTEYFDKLKSLIGKGKNITFIKNPSDSRMVNLYASCYAVLATSFNEDWGITPIEANAYGKPVLAVDSGGFKESQINGKTGFLLANNPKIFSSKMLLLAGKTNTTRRMGRYARLNSEKYSWRNFITKLDKFQLP
jgi:glycosyltransferase involved in cell wall biosynthesis